MTTATLEKPRKKRPKNPLADVTNLAELLDRLGNIPLERVRFHPELHRSHARWFLAEMRRWAWLPRNLDLERVAQELYRPEFLIENTASSPPSDRATNLQHTK